MKIKYIVFALLTLPSMALAAKIDTSSISSANDMDMAEANLWSVFKTRSESVDKQLIASETERIEAAITAGKDAFANKDVSKLKDPTKDKLSARNRNAKNNRRNNNNNNNGDADDLTGNENANNSAVVASGLGKLSDADMAKRHDELQKNYQNMKDKEQSAANKAIGAVGIGAGGIGTMMLSQSLAEKQADEAAERDMKAYLQTFKCDYGQGPNIRGGTENVELPGANTLLPLYQEYMALAEDLKIRKEALGMKPGIESEVILDKANMGLYDDVNLGIEGGAYASLSRAMRNPEGEDASLWQAQKDKTKQNMIIGASVAAAGLIGSGIANLAVNKNAPKENSDAINANYDSMREQLVAEEPENLTTIPEEVAEEVLEENPEEVEPDYSNEDKCINSGGEYRHGTCDCTNMGIPGSAYEKDGKCECDTDAGFELIDNKCQCKLGSGYNDTKNKCVVCATLKQAISNDGKCVPCNELIPGTEWDEEFQTCICDDDTKEMVNGSCVNKTEDNQCKLTGKFVDLDTCTCVSPAVENNASTGCDCLSNNISEDGTKCLPPEIGLDLDEPQRQKSPTTPINPVEIEEEIAPEEEVVVDIPIGSKYAKFSLGKVEILNKKGLINEITKQLKQYNLSTQVLTKVPHCVTLVGKTDNVRKSQTATHAQNVAHNRQLGQQRADNVKKELVKAGLFNEQNIVTSSIGGDSCKTKSKTTEDPTCRRVDLKVSLSACSAS